MQPRTTKPQPLHLDGEVKKFLLSLGVDRVFGHDAVSSQN